MRITSQRFRGRGTVGLALLAVGWACVPARAGDPEDTREYRLDASPASFTLQPAQPAEQPDAASKPPESDATSAEPPQLKLTREYGAAGSKWWTVGLSGADNFQNAVDTSIYGAFSYFLAKDIEFSLEAAVWHFNQPGDNAAGGSATILFRWHFIDTGKWTVYVDGGVGLLLASDDVPPDGTSFDFMPRAGAGFTRLLDDDGLRLEVGLTWHHISNARITGDEDNPGRDSAMIYAGLVFPF